MCVYVFFLLLFVNPCSQIGMSDWHWDTTMMNWQIFIYVIVNIYRHSIIHITGWTTQLLKSRVLLSYQPFPPSSRLPRRHPVPAHHNINDNVITCIPYIICSITRIERRILIYRWCESFSSAHKSLCYLWQSISVLVLLLICVLGQILC